MQVTVFGQVKEDNSSDTLQLYCSNRGRISTVGRASSVEREVVVSIPRAKRILKVIK